MSKNDPFIEGLRLLFEAKPDLKPAKVSVDAGLDNSTIRKLLSSANASPKVETAKRIADAMGYPLTTIISLGSHESGEIILEILESIEGLHKPEIKELLQFLEYLNAKSRNEEDSSPGKDAVPVTE